MNLTQILDTSSIERSRKIDVKSSFLTAYSNCHIAADLLEKMADSNVGNTTRKQTAELATLLTKACSAALALDEWRKKNPHPDDPKTS